MDEVQIGIFIDTENLTCWLKNNGLEQLLKKLATIGRPTIRRAYGNWALPGLHKFQANLNGYGFKFSHHYHPVSGKNSSDMKMAAEVMRIAGDYNGIDFYVLATGDSDFSPIFVELTEMGYQVIGVGPKSALSDSVQNFCYAYYFTDDVAEETTEDSECLSIMSFEEAVLLTKDILKSFDGPVNCSTLKQNILAKNSTFNERGYGVQSFTEFLLAIDDIELSQAENGNGRYASLIVLPPEMPEEVVISQIFSEVQKRYESALKHIKWYPLPKSTLAEVIEFAYLLPALPRAEIPLSIASLSKRKISEKDARKVVNILFKSELYASTATAASNQNAKFQLKRCLDYFPEIDKALVIRLKNICEKEGEVLDIQVLQGMVYGEYTVDQLRTLCG